MRKITEPSPIQFEFSSLYPCVVLASQSPNRRLLLELGGTAVTPRPQDTDETIEGSDWEEGIRINALRKMESYLSSVEFDPEKTAISADTLVLINGELYGKPKDEEDARHTLHVLSGHEQVVLTGCALYTPDGKTVSFCDKATVIFKELTDEEIESYIATGEWQGAAGAYRLQKTGHTLVERIDGDWTTVVGLPLKRLIELAK